jgi:hypothetical protein
MRKSKRKRSLLVPIILIILLLNFPAYAAETVSEEMGKTQVR